MPFAIPSDPDANSRNLSRLCLLRAILIVVLALAALFSGWLESVPLLQDKGILAALSLLTVFNIWSLWRLHRGGAVGEAGLFAQMMVDVLLMTLVFYRTGGSTNPFVSWYLVPLTIAAAILRIGYTMALALLTLAVYSLLLAHYIPFAPFAGIHAGHLPAAVELVDPHAHHHMTLQPAGQGGFNLHVFGMWLNFILSAALITFFVTRMSGALREQDRQLARQHESLLQREQVVALGALAAGAAHELGTPLSTMAILAHDIESDLPADSPLRADMALLRRQLALCRDILGDLREQAGGLPRLSLEKFMCATVERMEVVHPARHFLLDDNMPVGSIVPPATLQQVLVNLLDNAAQAARHEVKIALHGTGEDCLLEIDDDGPGIAPEIAARLGQAFVSDKDEGMGLGYFLSHASVNQMGGSLHFRAAPGGGTRAELRLPWAVLQHQPDDEA